MYFFRKNFVRNIYIRKTLICLLSALLEENLFNFSSKYVTFVRSFKEKNLNVGYKCQSIDQVPRRRGTFIFISLFVFEEIFRPTNSERIMITMFINFILFNLLNLTPVIYSDIHISSLPSKYFDSSCIRHVGVYVFLPKLFLLTNLIQQSILVSSSNLQG